MSETLGRIATGDPHTIRLEDWHHVLKDGKETGMLRLAQGRTGQEVLADLKYEMKELLEAVEYVSLGFSFREEYPTTFQFARIPRYRGVACYARTGGNEGHYVHVDLVLNDGTHANLVTVKTFMGVEHAWKIAIRAAELLEA